jgi:hypothetical protein
MVAETKAQLFLQIKGQCGQHDLGDIIACKVEKVAEYARFCCRDTQVLVTVAAARAEAIAQHAMHHDAVPAGAVTLSMKKKPRGAHL